MFFMAVDRTAPKNDIRAALLWIANENGETLSQARADKLATKFKRGEFDPELARFIQYSDPVGEEASSNVDRERRVAA